MGLKTAQGILTLVFNVSFTALFFKVTANENFQQYVSCKPGWDLFGVNCYKATSNIRLSWVNSENACMLDGGHLATIHSNELQEFLSSIWLLNSRSNLWIGLHDRINESDFSWVDGSINNYTNWDDKQPSRMYGHNEEDCVEMRFSGFRSRIGSWNDESCDSLRNYVCQVNISGTLASFPSENETNISHPHVLDTQERPLIESERNSERNNDTKSPDPPFCSVEDGRGWKYQNSCYHIVKEEKSWEDAEKYCEENYKGFLVSILHDKDELFLDYIMEISNLSESVWIGIKMGNYSMQKWTSGWHVASKKTNQEQMHFVNGTCAMKSNGNSWGIAPCYNKYPFICEKIKYNVPVLQKPPSDNWKCPQSSKKLLDLGGDSCYYIENKLSRKWLEANYECGKIGGTLASFHSENETNILHPHVLDTRERLFIGLRRNSERKGYFEWADGTKFNYTNWNEWEPNNINEICGELWTASMKWNDIPCNRAKGYICKTKKVFFYSQMEEISYYAPSNSAVSKDQTFSGGVPAGTVVGIVFCTMIVSLFVGVIAYHYRDYWNYYCFNIEKDDLTSSAEGSLGHVSNKLIWKSLEEENTINF